MAHLDEDHDEDDGDGGQNRVRDKRAYFVWGVHGGDGGVSFFLFVSEPGSGTQFD